MIRAGLATTSVVDEAAETVRIVAAPWAALLIATALPYRFAQCVFVETLFMLGAESSRYGNYLQRLAAMTMAAFILARWGRLVFARATRLAIDSGRNPGREALRVPFAAFLNYLYLSLILELVSIAAIVTCLAPALCTMVNGFAIGTAEMNDQPSAMAPFRRIAQSGKAVRVGTGVFFVFVCAAAVAAINVMAAFRIGLWLGTSVGGWDVGRWNQLLSPANTRFLMTLGAGAILAIEPFWVASYVTLIRKAGAVESGDDLRAWFEELRSA